MTDDGLSRDSLREGLKAKGRSRRKAAARNAEAEKAGLRPSRNDMLPALRIELCPVDGLKLHARKLRKSDPAHVREIANSIRTLGFNVPLLVGKNNVVVDGDSRLEAAKVLGLSSVPCIRVDHLDETEQRLLRLAVNRLGEKGTWDLGELEAEFRELIIADAPIEISGFGSDEIDQVIIGADLDGYEAADLAPSEDSAIAQVGDLFLLGSHRLICGDATDPAVLSRLMRTDVARLVFTDEPFNVAIGGHVTGGEHREFVMASGEMTDAQFRDFNQKWMDAILPYLVDGGLLGTFIDWRGLPIAHSAATALGLIPLNLIVWAKTNAGMGSLYRSQHELLPLFKKGSAPHVNNIALGKRGRHRSNLWTYPGASSVGSDARKGLQDHPTVKPTAMLQDALIDLTNRGEIVLDSFLGSGSTLMAAENTGRLCCGVELDPRYVDIIIRRYETATRTTAILADTGEPFATVAARRRNDERDGRQ
ncbi:site-specific DNA-methyltransferase [Bradyrhizobium sp. USDA 3364]